MYKRDLARKREQQAEYRVALEQQRLHEPREVATRLSHHRVWLALRVAKDRNGDDAVAAGKIVATLTDASVVSPLRLTEEQLTRCHEMRQLAKLRAAAAGEEAMKPWRLMLKRRLAKRHAEELDALLSLQAHDAEHPGNEHEHSHETLIEHVLKKYRSEKCGSGYKKKKKKKKKKNQKIKKN
mgnify:CR=1 FL=1